MKTLIYEIIAAAGTIESAGNRILRPFGLTPMTFNILNVLTDGPLSRGKSATMSSWLLRASHFRCGNCKGRASFSAGVRTRERGVSP